MNTLLELNNFSSANVVFTVDTLTVQRTVGQSFFSPIISWTPVRQLGPSTGNGAQITYNVSSVANTTVSFPLISNSINPLTTANPSTGVYTIRGTLEAQDYLAAQPQINPPVGFANTITYTANVINTNSSAGNFFVTINGVPG
jgi:hypothetical protein